MDYDLRNIPELLKDYLGPGKIVKHSEVTKLTQAGDHAGSVMLKLDVIIINKKDDSEETLHAVAKILPDTELFRKVFHVQTTYTNEMSFYEVILPTLQNFQKELGIEQVIDLFPKCIANRRNLAGSSEIGEDTVLVLENLIESGYQNIDRCEGFDLETAKLILKDIAEFHAVPLALKIRNPEIFQQKIKVHCSDFDPKYLKGMEDLVRDLVKQDEAIAHLAPKIVHWGQIERSKPREPFATMIHTDLWTNNTMQQFKNGRLVSNKIVDFQLITYGSPAADVFFFIWSSIPREVLEPHLEFLLRYYHEQFINVLRKHQVYTAPFSYEKFLKEMELESEYEFGHASLFFVNSATKRQRDREPFEGSYVDYVLNHSPQRLKDKLRYMVEECVRRRWLK